MVEIEETVGQLRGDGRRFALVAARFNGRLVESLIDGAVDCLRRHGVADADLHLVRVPGAWEIPTALAALAAQGSYDGFVALGVVVRGQTPHFDYVCSTCASGCSEVARQSGKPVGFGVLTCDNSEQAAERSGGKAGNKGWEAAEATLEMVDLVGRLS